MKQLFLRLDLIWLVEINLLWEQLWCTLTSRLWKQGVAQKVCNFDEAEGGNEPVPVSFQYDVAPSPTLKTFVFKPNPVEEGHNDLRSHWPVSRSLPSRHQEWTCSTGVGGWAVVGLVCCLRWVDGFVSKNESSFVFFRPLLAVCFFLNECVR